MSDKPLQIHPSTKVAQLLEAFPELEDVLIRMAPPFKKLKNLQGLQFRNAQECDRKIAANASEEQAKCGRELNRMAEGHQVEIDSRRKNHFILSLFVVGIEFRKLIVRRGRLQLTAQNLYPSLPIGGIAGWQLPGFKHGLP